MMGKKCVKHWHPTEQSATEQLLSLKHMGLPQADLLVPYYCSQCKGWHLTRRFKDDGKR